MCIYCTTTNYRKIYENHVGEIPREEDGRTYEIHHIDGNHENNDVANLVAVTLREHYDIHKKQGDYYAALLLAEKLKLSPTELSDLATKNNDKRVADGTHPWTKREDGSSFSKDLVDAGLHHLSGGDIQRGLVESGDHHLLDGDIQRKSAIARAEAGTHPAQSNSNPFWGGEIQRKAAKEGKLAVQIQGCCLVCREQTNISALARRHGKNCGKNAITVAGVKYRSKKVAMGLLGITMYELNKILKNE